MKQIIKYENMIYPSSTSHQSLIFGAKTELSLQALTTHGIRHVFYSFPKRAVSYSTTFITIVMGLMK